jgi:hypothetical protein
MKLLFLPIDINLENFSFSQKEDPEKNNVFNPWWNSTLINEPAVEENNFDKILNQLPFTKITRLFYKTQKIAVSSHVDVMPQMTMEDNEYDHIKLNEPCGYRIVINGSLDTLKILNNKSWITASLPKTPCCYVLNSTELYHSVESDPFRETIYIRGFLDQQKHKLLLEKSFKKFKNYAIYQP